MKKLVIFIFTIAFLLSCKKNKIDTLNNAISVKMDNDIFPTEFNYLGYAFLDTVSGNYKIDIVAYQDNSYYSNYINLAIVDPLPITTATYAGSYYQTLVGAYINYIIAAPFKEYQSKLYSGTNNDNTVIAITSINSTTVQGTFSGTVYYPWNSTQPINFSNGTFKVKIL